MQSHIFLKRCLACCPNQAWHFLIVSSPVSVLCAPLGSVLGSHFHRHLLALLVVILDAIALVTAFIIIPVSVSVGFILGGIIVGGVAFFGLLAYAGKRLQASEVS